MDFIEELKNYDIYEADEEITTFHKAIEKLIEHPNTCVKYRVNRTFEVNNIGVLETSQSGQAFFDVLLERCETDVISNVRCSEPFETIIGEKFPTLSSSNYILLCATPYMPVKFRILVNRDVPVISLTYDAMLLPHTFRNRVSTWLIKCGDAYYHNGLYTHGSR